MLFLGLVVAALLRDVRQVQRGIRRERRSEPWPASLVSPTGVSLVLVVSEGCSVCAEAAVTLSSAVTRVDGLLTVSILADTDSVRHASSGSVRVVTDDDTYARLFPGWVPALAVFEEGELKTLQPAGSEEAVLHIVDTASKRVSA